MRPPEHFLRIQVRLPVSRVAPRGTIPQKRWTLSRALRFPHGHRMSLSHSPSSLMTGLPFSRVKGGRPEGLQRESLKLFGLTGLRIRGTLDPGGTSGVS